MQRDVMSSETEDTDNISIQFRIPKDTTQQDFSSALSSTRVMIWYVVPSSERHIAVFALTVIDN